MNVTTIPGTLKKFHRTPWRFQQTVELPDVGKREQFISSIIDALDDFKAAAVTIDQVIFNTERMTDLCNPTATLTHDTTIAVDSADELLKLLLAAFWDGLDFICIPKPKPFVFYADHDDWITFYANTKSNLNHVIEPLSSRGYKLIQDWQR